MSSRSDTACIYLICMTYKDWERKSWRREDEEGEEREDKNGRNRRRYKIGEKVPPKSRHVPSGLTVNSVEVCMVQRTFEMAHLKALYSTPRQYHHLHTSHQMKMDGENQCHWDECFIKVTLPSKLLKPLYLIAVVGILTYQHNLFIAEEGAMGIYQQKYQRNAGWLLSIKILIFII